MKNSSSAQEELPKSAIVLDTETTGFEPSQGHRLVEVGCVEIVNYLPTGRTFQVYINPERDMPIGAFRVHGLSADFLSGFPKFSEVASEFLDFIQDRPLVIHNASFDMKFLQAELRLAELSALSNPVVDTLLIAREKFPGAPASLDMLCRRFQINNTHREKHGALLDAHLLSQVYLELAGGVQPNLEFSPSQERGEVGVAEALRGRRPMRAPRSFPVGSGETAAHARLLQDLGAPDWEA
jgi:DNA polymerase-3 subunit epsilon